MKRFFLLICVLSLAFTSVSAKITSYTCTFKVLETEGEGPVYRDSNLQITLNLTETAVNFKVENQSSAPIFLDWEKSVMILNGNSKRCIHSGIKYSQREKEMAKSTIAPGSSLIDGMTPADNVYLEGNDGLMILLVGHDEPEWRIKRIVNLTAFQKKDIPSIYEQIGKKIGVMLAFEINGQMVYKTFTLVLTGFQEVKKK